MAIAQPAVPFEIGDRVTSDGANTYGAPVNQTGRVVAVRNSVTSTGLTWIIRVRLPVSGEGPSSASSFDFEYLAADLASANP